MITVEELIKYLEECKAEAEDNPYTGLKAPALYQQIIDYINSTME